MDSKKRVAINTVFIYLKLGISVVVGLYTVRIVLSCLGSEDFGLYSLVGGTIATLAFLESSMTNTSLRFLAYNMSKSQKEITSVFDTVFILHIVLAFILCGFLELSKDLIFCNILNIPESKLFSASIVYHCFVCTTFVTITSSPFDALMTAHEDIRQLAIIDTMGIFFVLFVALSMRLYDGNALIFYALGLAANQVLLRVIKQIYALSKYQEASIHNYYNGFNKELAANVLSLCGWNVFGSLAAVCIVSVKGIMMNHFFALRYNAAEGVSSQVSGKISQFSNSISQALLPIIFRSEGASNREKMLYTMSFSTRVTSFLFSLIAIPVFFFLPELLSIWLTEVPEGCVLFVRFLIITTYVEKLGFDITNAIRAVGDIKAFQITETCIILCSPIVASIALLLGGGVQYVYITYLMSSCICFIVRVYFGKIKCGLDSAIYLRMILKSIIVPSLVVCCLYYVFILLFEISIFMFCISTLVLSVLFMVLFYIAGLSSPEKKVIVNAIRNKL